MRCISDGNCHQVVTKLIVILTRYSSSARGCQSDEVNLDYIRNNQLLTTFLFMTGNAICITSHINQLIVKKHVTPRNDKKQLPLFRITKIELCHAKNEMTNTCKNSNTSQISDVTNKIHAIQKNNTRQYTCTIQK